MNKFKIFIISFLILVLAILVAFVIYYKYSFKLIPSKAPEESKSILTDKKSFSTSEMPYNFPNDIPREAGAKIIENYTAQVPTVNKSGLPDNQSTYKYISTRSIDEIYNTYKKYFESKKWKMLSDVNLPNMKVMAMEVPLGFLQFTAQPDTASKNTIVSISVVFHSISPGSVDSSLIKK